ncbi:LCP family protein [Microbacterium sp. NPDC089318]
MTSSSPELDARRSIRARRTRRWIWGIVFVVVGLLVAVAVVGVGYVARLSSSYDKAETMPPSEVFPSATARPADVNSEAVNILLLGSDSRQGLGGSVGDIRGQRADTMLLVHIPADRSGVQVISFMRDNWVEIPGYGNAKLNAALAYGGTPLLVQTLEKIIDVRIDHVAITDFEGFKGLSEALDGVTVNNQVAFKNGKFSYPKGQIELRGDKALSYVRARYPFSDGDYQRVRNQQAFIKGMLDKLVSRETLTDPGRVAASVDALAPYLAVDAGLDAGTVASLGLSLRDVDKSEILFLTSPTLGTGMVGDQSIVKPDWDGLAALSDALKNDTVPRYAAEHANK